jgi:hypothetical protein
MLLISERISLLGIITERIYSKFEIGSQYYYLFEQLNFNPKERKCNSFTQKPNRIAQKVLKTAITNKIARGVIPDRVH